MKTNREKLVKISVQGKVAHPIGGTARIDSEGIIFAVPAIGGITYNVKVGDRVFGLVADHIEPGVSLKNTERSESDGLNVFSCIGNKARVVSGKAEGDVGYVTGIHGGCEHVIIYFPDETLQKMKIGDEVLVEAYGQGMKIEGNDDILVQSIDPELLDYLNIKEEDGILEVPVAGIVPSYLMGSGVGANHSYSGDYDLMTADFDAIKEHGLQDLRFGDVLLLTDSDNTFGRGYLKGATTIGIVIHGDCRAHGHGPGITTVLTSKKTKIKGVLSKDANIAEFIMGKYSK